VIGRQGANTGHGSVGAGQPANSQAPSEWQSFDTFGRFSWPKKSGASPSKSAPMGAGSDIYGVPNQIRPLVDELQALAVGGATSPFDPKLPMLGM